MREYEIRILSAGHTIAVIEETHFSDDAAVRSGKKFAADRLFEVWRGLDCIYEAPDATGLARFVQKSPLESSKERR